MSKNFLHRGLLVAMIVPALLTAGCAASGTGQAMKGAASPAPPTSTETGMPDSPAPGDSPTQGAQSSPRAVVEQFYKALASGNADQVAKMFTSDGVAAVQGKETAKGTQALTEAFQGEEASGTPSFEKSENLGKQAAVVSATSGQGADATRGAFLLKKEGQGWKISYFMNNSPS